MSTRVQTTIAVIVCLASLMLKVGIQKKLVETTGARLALKPLQASYHGESLKKYSFGFDNFIADAIWVQLIQAASHEKLKDGRVSWEYAQLEAITTLDPHFEHAYPFGSAYLSVFREDNLGAKLLLQKWVKHRPTYWRPHYLLGYHLYFELNEYAEAAQQMLIASSLEHAPPWLASLGIRLLSETGAVAQALSQSIELYPAIQESFGRSRLIERIRSLHFTYEKNTWNEALVAYRKVNHREPKTLQELKPFRVSSERTLASLVNTEQLPPDLASILNEKYLFSYDSSTRGIAASGGYSGIDKIGIFRPNQRKSEK